MKFCVSLKHTLQVTKKASPKTHYSTKEWHGHLEKQPGCPQTVAQIISMRGLCQKTKDQVAQRQRIMSGNGGGKALTPSWTPGLMPDYANPKHR